MIAALLTIVLAAGAPTVSDHEYDRVESGWTRAHVQHVFDTTGTRTAMWATGHRRHLIKSYPAADGGTVTVEFVGPLTAQPYEAPYRVKSKDRAS